MLGIDEGSSQTGFSFARGMFGRATEYTRIEYERLAHHLTGNWFRMVERTNKMTDTQIAEFFLAQALPFDMALRILMAVPAKVEVLTSLQAYATAKSLV